MRVCVCNVTHQRKIKSQRLHWKSRTIDGERFSENVLSFRFVSRVWVEVNTVQFQYFSGITGKSSMDSSYMLVLIAATVVLNEVRDHCTLRPLQSQAILDNFSWRARSAFGVVIHLTSKYNLDMSAHWHRWCGVRASVEFFLFELLQRHSLGSAHRTMPKMRIDSYSKMIQNRLEYRYLPP